MASANRWRIALSGSSLTRLNLNRSGGSAGIGAFRALSRLRRVLDWRAKWKEIRAAGFIQPGIRHSHAFGRYPEGPMERPLQTLFATR